MQSQALGPRDSRDPGIDATIRMDQEQRAERRAELHDLPVPPELERLRFKAGPPPCKAYPGRVPPGCTLIATMSVWLKRRHNKHAWICRSCFRHLELNKLLLDDPDDPEHRPHVLTQGDIDLY